MPDKPHYTLAQMKQETSAKPHYTAADLKKVDGHLGIIQLISGTTAKGEDFYAYVSVYPSLYEEFLLKMESKVRLDIEKFGKILQKGYGKDPSAEIKQSMKEKFGIDHDFTKHFIEDVEKLRKDKK